MSSSEPCCECGKESVYVSRFPSTGSTGLARGFYCEDDMHSLLSTSPAFIFVNPDLNPQHIWCEGMMYHKYSVDDAVGHGKWFRDQSDNAYVLYFRKGKDDFENPVKLSLKDDWSLFESYARNIREFLENRRGRRYPSKGIQFSLEMCFEPTGSDDQ